MSQSQILKWCTSDIGSIDLARTKAQISDLCRKTSYEILVMPKDSSKDEDLSGKDSAFSAKENEKYKSYGGVVITKEKECVLEAPLLVSSKIESTPEYEGLFLPERKARDDDQGLHLKKRKIEYPVLYRLFVRSALFLGVKRRRAFYDPAKAKDQTLKSIIEKVIKDYPNIKIDFRLEDAEKEKVEVCVQCDETDAEFLERIMRAAHFIYFLTYDKDEKKEVLVITDKDKYQSKASEAIEIKEVEHLTFSTISKTADIKLEVMSAKTYGKIFSIGDIVKLSDPLTEKFEPFKGKCFAITKLMSEINDVTSPNVNVITAFEAVKLEDIAHEAPLERQEKLCRAVVVNKEGKEEDEDPIFDEETGEIYIHVLLPKDEDKFDWEGEEKERVIKALIRYDISDIAIPKPGDVVVISFDPRVQRYDDRPFVIASQNLFKNSLPQNLKEVIKRSSTSKFNIRNSEKKGGEHRQFICSSVSQIEEFLNEKEDEDKIFLYASECNKILLLRKGNVKSTIEAGDFINEIKKLDDKAGNFQNVTEKGNFTSEIKEEGDFTSQTKKGNFANKVTEEGNFTNETKKGSISNLTEAGNIQTSTKKGDMTFSAKEGTILFECKKFIVSADEVEIKAATSHKLNAGKSSQESSGDFVLKSGTGMEIKSGTALTQKSGTNMELNAGINLSCSASAQVKVNGALVKLN